MAGIYVHIPFCRQACHYCNFHFSTNLTRVETMVEAICREAQLRHGFLSDQEVSSLYLGGGTPSVLSPGQLRSIVETVDRYYNLKEDKEFTIEVNPDDVEQDLLNAWSGLGVNRLSIGLQSIDNAALQHMNRLHDGQEGVAAVEQARQAGFDNLNVDLIYGVTDDNHSRWARDLEMVRSLRPEHISSYALTIEEKTVFGNWAGKGKLSVVTDDYIAEEYEMAEQAFEDLGYEHYEVSNYALPGKQSAHNSSYWKDKPYLGLGPSAHSYDGTVRSSNVSNNSKYLEALAWSEPPAEVEVLTKADRINEYLLTGLRTKWGISTEGLLERGHKFDDTTLNYLQQLDAEGYASWDDKSLRLTGKGLFLADEICARLFVESEPDV